MVKAKSLLDNTHLDRVSYPTPFMITDVNAVKQNYRLLKDEFADFHIHYAMKSNPDEQILKALKEIGSSFEIASYGELELLMKIGIDPSSVLYSNPVKPTDHIRKSYEAGVRYYAFDSALEIKKIAEVAPGSNVYLRLRVSNQGSSFPLTSKFGANAEQAAELMKMAQEFGLNPIGLTFHVGSQSASPETWSSAFETAGRVMLELRREGIILEMLNIGGGFPVEYTSRVPEMYELGYHIKESLKLYIPYPVTLRMEPGRYLVANSSVIVSEVIGREVRGNVDWIYLDVGAFQGLIESLEMPGWQFPMISSRESTKRQSGLTPYTVTGPTCDAQDTIAHEVLLPRGLTLGDRVYIGCTGAYTLTYAAAAFNGFPPPKVYYDNIFA
jgi:ornithine decarboxylase